MKLTLNRALQYLNNSNVAPKAAHIFVDRGLRGDSIPRVRMDGRDSTFYSSYQSVCVLFTVLQFLARLRKSGAVLGYRGRPLIDKCRCSPKPGFDSPRLNSVLFAKGDFWLFWVSSCMDFMPNPRSSLGEFLVERFWLWYCRKSLT
jgi:hypothetical protein